MYSYSSSPSLFVFVPPSLQFTLFFCISVVVGASGLCFPFVVVLFVCVCS